VQFELAKLLHCVMQSFQLLGAGCCAYELLG
jgi:hypothetical protein